MRSGARQLCSMLALALLCGAARGDASLLVAGLSCAKLDAPGRILCDLHANAPSAKLVWADALVVAAPEFARPLRSRVALQLLAGTSQASAKLALVGARPGKGELAVLVRGVVCRATSSGEVCHPEQQRVSTELEVSAAAPPTAP